MKKRRTLVLFVIFSLFACNVDGANGIFYAITQEVEAEKSNLDIRLTPKDMIETESAEHVSSYVHKMRANAVMELPSCEIL